jgi:copper homeostasis protein CutC
MPNAAFINVVYIDTSVFEHRQFDLQSHVFTALRNLIREGHARLLTSAITVGECHKHIQAHVGQASLVRNELSADARVLKRFKEYAVPLRQAGQG